MAKICLCLTENTIQRNLEVLARYRKYIDLAELRVDCLDPDERLVIRRFPELVDLPVILTIRRDIDGGCFTGGDGARIKLLARGLAFAEADTRLNFAYVDIEDDLNVPSLEEAARTFGTRIIRSYHDMDGEIDDIPRKIKSMRRTGDEIIKIAVTAKSTRDVLRLFQASRAFANQEKILICMGHLGVYSRILAERFGSVLNYASAYSSASSPVSEGRDPAAPGQLDIREMSELYRFKKINKNTSVYGVVGYPLMSSVSPLFFNAVFKLEDTDAVYVPFPVDSIPDFMELAGELDVKGLSVTVPYKEAVLPYLEKKSPQVQLIGACNTMSRAGGESPLPLANSPKMKYGWFGENTDAPGFSDSLLSFLGRKNLRWKKISIIGAGGVARAVAAEIYRLGGKALILNRTIYKARAIASLYGFRWGGLDNQGIEFMDKYSDIIIQTTSAGMEGSDADEPLESYTFTGKEKVMDLIYKPEVTPFLKRAAAAGCKTTNGYDMVIGQACLQYALFTGKDFPRQLLSRINLNWRRSG